MEWQLDIGIAALLLVLILVKLPSIAQSDLVSRMERPRLLQVLLLVVILVELLSRVSTMLLMSVPRMTSCLMDSLLYPNLLEKLISR